MLGKGGGRGGQPREQTLRKVSQVLSGEHDRICSAPLTQVYVNGMMLGAFVRKFAKGKEAQAEWIFD